MSTVQLHFWISVRTICDLNSVHNMRAHTHAHTRTHTQGKTCNVYILAIISEPNIRTSGVVGNSNIVLSEEVYIAKKNVTGQ